MLPEDGAASGFDNVGSALNLSSGHFVRYQEAAEKALATVMPIRPVKKFSDHRTFQTLEKNAPGFPGMVGKTMKTRDDALVMFSQPANTGPYRCIFHDLQPGTYNINLSASAVNSHGKPLPLVFSHASIEEVHYNGGTPRRLWLDVQPDKPTEITYEFIARPQERLIVYGWTLPTENDFVAKRKKDGIPLDKCEDPAIAVQWLDIEGPLDAPPGDGYRTLFGDLPLKITSVVAAEHDHKPAPKFGDKRKDEEWKLDPLIPVSMDAKADSERLLRSFLPRAFRKPVDDATVKKFQQFALERMEKGYAFGDAMLAAYRSALCSTYFLFLDEKPGPLDGYALAARLSYFVWRSMPDAELLKLAENGTLTKPEVLHAQLERLLKDPKAKRFIQDFTGQWLDMRKIDATVPDEYVYPDFNPYLLWSMPQETERFFSEVLDKNLSVLQFIDSDWTFANERLAELYGLKDIDGSQLRRVSLPKDSHRGGLLCPGRHFKSHRRRHAHLARFARPLGA